MRRGIDFEITLGLMNDYFAEVQPKRAAAE